MRRSRPKRFARIRRRCPRRGSITLEVALILPILLLLLIATIQFSIFAVVEQAVAHAATVGAREAAKGASITQLESIVETLLAPHGVTLGSHASVLLEDPQATPSIQQAGTLTVVPAAAPVLETRDVRVTVCVDLGYKPFLNALAYIGLDYTGKPFSISSLARKAPEIIP